METLGCFGMGEIRGGPSSCALRVAHLHRVVLSKGGGGIKGRGWGDCGARETAMSSGWVTRGDVRFCNSAEVDGIGDRVI